MTTAYNRDGFKNNTATPDQLYDLSASNTIGLGFWDNGTSKQLTVMPAYYGDANGDGKVDISDLTQLISYFGRQSGMVWSDGDFNYDGKVDISDLTSLISDFGKQNGPVVLDIAGSNLDAQAIAVLSGAGFSVTTVPEPSSLIMLASLLALGGVWAIARRRPQPRCLRRRFEGCGRSHPRGMKQRGFEGESEHAYHGRSFCQNGSRTTTNAGGKLNATK